MKKNFTFTAIIKAIASSAAITLITSCEREQPSGFQRNDGGVTLYATLEQPADTKTALQADGSVLWEPSEEIAVFSGSKSAKYTSTNDEPAAEAHFTPEDKSFTLGNDVWALYPYDEEATFADGVITTTIPADQTACEGTFARGANVTVAHSTTADLKFYNVCGGVRFSVTEEGINKVIFEGLDGEVIAGKVQIALDESGLPYVKDVLDGRLFITLTPPSGSTFEPGRWYYLSALPGALENGFKLRFYKDETYAKFISDKSVTVKRSVFGSLAKVDSGTVQNETSLSLPDNEEEVKRSIEITKDIEQNWDWIIAETRDVSNPKFLAQQISKAENVAYAEVINESTIVVTQADGVAINIFLETYNSNVDVENNSFNEPAAKTSKSNINETFYNYYHENESSILQSGFIESGKKALILAPFYGWSYNAERLSNYKSMLIDAGFSENDIIIKKNDEAGISSFYGSMMDGYDLLVISTHGGIGSAYSPVSCLNETALFVTGTKYDENCWAEYLNNKVNIPAICYISDSGLLNVIKDITDIGTTTSTAYLGITPNFLNDTGDSAFEGSCVLIEACHSADMISDGSRPFMDAFYQKGAKFVLGFKGEVATVLVANPFVNSMIDYMTQGISAEDAWSLTNTGIRYESSTYYCRETPFYLVYPFPILSIDGYEASVKLSWEMKTTGSYNFDVYVDGSIVTTTRNYSYTVNNLSSKKHEFYVVAKYRDSDMNFEYKSTTEYFTVTGEEQEEETELNSRTYGGKKYSIVRKNLNTGNSRVNGDGSVFHECSYSVKVGRTVYDIPGTFYSYQTDRDDNDLGPALAVDQSTGDMWLFILEKDVDNYYGMCGYVYKISNGSISKTTVFDMANFGWFPFFNHEEGRLALNSFSYAGYYSLICFEDEDWSLYGWYDIYPDDFKDMQAENEMIYIF